MVCQNNVHLKYLVCPFRPTYLTLAKGSKIISAEHQANQIVIYAHTVDLKITDQQCRELGVQMALDDKSWEVWEIRVYRAGMPTNLPDNAQCLGTVVLREGKCYNHVYAINLGSPNRSRHD